MRKLKTRNNILLASGTKGDGLESIKECYDMGLGAVVTKSVTITPRDAYPEPTFVPLDNGGFLNAVGLANPGAVEFSRMLGSPGFPVIVSLAGDEPSDFAAMADLFDGVVGFELNLSCPHVSGMGHEVGDDPELVSQIVQATRNATSLPVFAKIGPWMHAGVEAAISAGIDGITAINTVPAALFDNSGAPLLGNIVGGMSGIPIKTIAIRTIHEILSRHDVPIIGCGGIQTYQDVLDYQTVGAFAVQIGSAAMHNPNVISAILESMENS